MTPDSDATLRRPGRPAHAPDVDGNPALERRLERPGAVETHDTVAAEHVHVRGRTQAQAPGSSKDARPRGAAPFRPVSARRSPRTALHHASRTAANRTTTART